MVQFKKQLKKLRMLRRVLKTINRPASVRYRQLSMTMTHRKRPTRFELTEDNLEEYTHVPTTATLDDLA